MGRTGLSAARFSVGGEQAAELSVLYFRAVSEALQRNVEIQVATNGCSGSSLTGHWSCHFFLS